MQDPPLPEAGRTRPAPARRLRRGRARRATAALLALCMGLSGALPPALAQTPVAGSNPVRLPSLGESASSDLSISAERRLGEQIMRAGRRDPAFLDDPVLVEYLQALWQPLLQAGRKLGHIEPEVDRAFAWEAFLVRDRSVNAFAMPGGFVGAHLGLIALTTTSDQLASVLAHELAHVSQRHIARSIAPQQTASMLALATMLLGIIAASRSGNYDAANAAMMGGQAAAIQSQLNFSRDMEREADRVGFSVLEAAGFSTAGMAAMFERMDAATRLNDFGGFPYLRSHPLTVDRISEARNRILLTGAAAGPPTLQHAVMSARARVLMDESTQALQRLNGQTSSPLLVDRVQALYGGALAASRLREHERAAGQADEALQLAQTAQTREPDAERSIRLLQAELALARSDAVAALQVLDTLPHAGTVAGGRAPLLLRARALLEATASGAAGAEAPGLRATTEALQSWVAEHPADAAAWDSLSRTSAALGLQLRAMRASAEARAAVGDLGGAIDRLRAAQQLPRRAGGADFIDVSIIDTRLRQLTAQRRELALEERQERGGRGPDG